MVACRSASAERIGGDERQLVTPPYESRLHEGSRPDAAGRPHKGVNVPRVKGMGTRSSPSPPYAVVAKLANAPDLDSGGFSPCRFDSGLPHAALTTKVSALLGFSSSMKADMITNRFPWKCGEASHFMLVSYGLLFVAGRSLSR